MPGVNGDAGAEAAVANGRNGGAVEGAPPAARKTKSDDSASFLRAARGGNTEKVLEYLKNGTDINTCNANGLNALHLASKEGHKAIVTELLGRGAKIDSATKKGNTALHIASLAGQNEVVKILVTHSASVNVQSQNGFTPLYMAAQENHDEVVRFLLASGASQSLATEDGFTPLAVALQQGHDKVVAVLLENDTRGKVRLPALHIAAKKDDTKAAALLLQNDHNPDVTSKSGFTPLHIAAHYGNESIAVVLLQRGADVNYSAKHNITPLHVAAKWGKGNMVGLLLDKGANLEARTRDGLTPLHCAARSGHENVVDMMLQRGAPISAKTKNGLAPVHMASQGDHVDAARVLLHHKAPVDEVTVDYLTALHVAAHCGHVRVAKLLLDRKADPNSRALNGFTPLHIACKKNRIKVVELLLKYGASKEAKTESGLTPLHVASFMGCMNIVIFLIQHQASPDEATVRGETPLHLAARANQTDIIRILLRNGAKVDARAREQQTPLHIASRLGNVDIVVLLLQSGAQVDAVTKDLYTALHIAAKEGQEEVAGILIEHSAEMSAATKKGFTPLHLAAKYGNMKVAKLLIAKDAPVDAEGKNGVTPLHVAVHYDNQNVAMLLLDKNASPHACAKNGYTPLHISAKKNQLDIAKTLLDYGAKVDAESKAGFSPLHLAGQEGHAEIASLLIKNGAAVNAKAKNGLTPIHLCAQENKVDVADLLVESGADCDAETKAGYTPLHVASHFGQMAMVKFLLEQGVRVDVQNELGYSPLHQAAQQGHSQIVNLLLEANASPNTTSNTGQTALSIAQKLGYISVVETLKVVTDTVVTTTTTTTVEEKYKVLAPESMQETFMSDSEDEGGEGEEPTNDKSYQYLTTDDVLKMGDDTQMDVTADVDRKTNTMPRPHKEAEQGADSIERKIQEIERQQRDKPDFGRDYKEDQFVSDNVNITGPPIAAGKLKWKSFLVSFMVDARGGAMRGCRHSGVRVIIPPRKAPMPMRVTCRYLKKDKLIHPPPLMEGEAIASRILELGPAGAKFLGPVILEVPHFASLRGKEREIVILRSDNGENWKEHTLEATEEAVQEVLQDSFDEGEATQLEDLNTGRITRILTTDFPQYFAIITRIRQEVHAIGPEGGVVNSTVVPQVQAVFPQGALTKKIKVGLQAQPIPTELTAKLLGNRVAVSPIVTVEPRRRKFHKPITLTIPVPVAASKGMINQYSGDTPTLRLLCSITGGTTRAQWEDVTGSTPLTFVNDCVNFTTTVSARFWLMDCRNVGEATKMATSLYKEAIYVPFMAKFCVFSKRHEMLEARMRVFCMTDDKEEKTLEQQEHFHEVAKSRDVEVLEGKTHHLEFYGNLFPVTKSGEQLSHKFHAFRENRLPFTVRVKDPNSEPLGRISFFGDPKQARGEAQQPAMCNLNINLPEDISPEAAHHTDADLLAIQAKYSFLREAGYGKFDTIHRADLRVSDISNLLGNDWIKLARELEIEDQDINLIISEYPDNVGQQAMVMLRLWLNTEGNKATGNALEKALKQCDREDIVNKCMFNVEQVTDNFEKRRAENELEDQAGFAAFKEDLIPTNNGGGAAGAKALLRDYSIHVNVDESEQRDSDGSFDLTQERLAGVTEEITVRSETIRDNKQEEATSVYEREEHKYVAEEKDFTSSIQKEQMSQNLISQSLRQETNQVTSNVVIQKTENKQEFLHEDMKKMSMEEKKTMRISDSEGVSEVTSESRLDEQHEEREEYNNQKVETQRTQMEEKDDGTMLIMTEAKTESRQAFSSQIQDSKRFEHTETTVTGAETSLDEAANLKTAELFTAPDNGFEEQVPASEFGDNHFSAVKPGTSEQRASSSYSSDESGPESVPHSPSPKVSPGSKSPSPRVSPLKDTEQELLDEMIIKDVPESESSTDPVKQFEDSHPPASIESIQEDQEDASDSECKDQPLSNLALATNQPLSSYPLPSPSSSDRSPEMPHKEDKSPMNAGLAAPDSKDSLEVQLTSACEDLSESQISGKGSLDEQHQRQESSESEEEHQPTVNERSASEDAGRRTSISEFVFEAEKNLEVQSTERKIQIVDTDVTTETSDDDFEFLHKRDVEESTDDDRFMPQAESAVEATKRLEKLHSIPSTDTEPRQSRPSSGWDVDSSDNERNTEVADPRIPSASSDYSDIEDKKVVPSTYQEQETPKVQTMIRKSSASSAISDIELKPKTVVDSSSEYDHENIKGEYVRDPQAIQPRPVSATSNYSTDPEKKQAHSSSESEEGEELTKTEAPRIPSASSDYSDITEKNKEIVKQEVESSESEEDGKTMNTVNPNIPSASSDYSDIEEKNTSAKPIDRKSSSSSALSETGKIEPKKIVPDSSDSEEEVIEVKTTDPRVPSASSDYSDLGEKKTIEIEKQIERKSSVSSVSEEEGIVVKASDPRIASASSDYSDLGEKKAETTTGRKASVSSAYSENEVSKPAKGPQIIPQISISSDFSDNGEKKQDEDVDEDEMVLKGVITKGSDRPLSSDYSDIEVSKVVMRKQSEPIRPSSSDYSDIDVMKNRKQSEPSRPLSSDYSDVEVNRDNVKEKKSEPVRQSSSDYSDVEVKKDKVTRKQSEPVRPSSSDYSDVEVNKDKVTRKYSEPAREASVSSEYSDTGEKKAVTLSDQEDEPIEPGIIQVVVHKAADLVNQEIMGKSDPYVIIKFRGQEFRSQTERNTINPEWNFTTDLLITEVFDSNINIEVFDDDNGLDSCEGILVLSLTDAIKRSSEEGRWYSLTNCKHGRIFVSCIYTSMPAPSKAIQPETSRTRTYSSSSSEEEVTKDQNTVLQQSSSDSSISNPREKAKVKHQMAMDRASMDDDADVKRGSIRPQSSSEYSDTDNERKGASGVESSSDYDSTPARMRKNRPASIVSDTSSDYSNVGSRARPLSQFLDDEYDVITEEEAAESKSEKKHEADPSSSSESPGPEIKDAEAKAQVIPPVLLSSMEDQEQDGDPNGASLLIPTLTPHPTLSSSVASNSAILSSDPHAEAEQTSVSVEVAKSSVINSNTLDEIGPLAEDQENGSLTKQIEKKNKEGDDPQSTTRISSSSCSSIDQAQRDGSSESERSQDLETETAETPLSTNTPSLPYSVKLPSETNQEASISVKNMQEIFEGISKSSVVPKAKCDSSVDESTKSQSTVVQPIKKEDSSETSDYEISSLQERPKSEVSESSESEACIVPSMMKRSGTDSSDYEIHSTIVLGRSTEGDREVSPKDKKAFESFVAPALEESQPYEHKPIPLKKELIKINSSDLLRRQIKEDMVEQVMSQEEDSVMSETNVGASSLSEVSSKKFADSGIKTDTGSNLSVLQATECELEEPDWELVDSENKKSAEEDKEIGKRSMTPEQALEVATEIVENVQAEALKKYGEMVKTNQLPKPTPDSKFTPETKEKAERYLKELEESEQYDSVAAELIHKVVTKKEEKLSKVRHDVSVDITDDEMHKSENMLEQLRAELNRSSVTDEDLTTDITQELLAEKNIEEIKKHLEDTRTDRWNEVSSDFRFQTGFRAHFVKDSDGEKLSSEAPPPAYDEAMSEDIWATEATVNYRKEFKSVREKKSDNESSSSMKGGDRRSGTDQEGYSSAGEFFTDEHKSSSGQSRPTSSDVEAMFSAAGTLSTTGTQEFLTAQDHSSADTSHFYSAVSTFSTHSEKSSDSSGHLGSVEVSECSETLVESSLEYEARPDDGSATPYGVKPLDEVSADEYEADLQTDQKRFSCESSTSTEKSKHSIEFNPSSASFLPSSESSILSPQEIQCLPEDDVDGCCFSTSKTDDEERKPILKEDSKIEFPIPDILASRFSESRETLSSSVLTLSSISETTVVGADPSQDPGSWILESEPRKQDDKKPFDLSGSATTMNSSTSSSYSGGAVHSAPKDYNSDMLESVEELRKDDTGLDFHEPRMQCFEGLHSMMGSSLPLQASIDLGSEYDSRPNSELKDHESRPNSGARLERTFSPEVTISAHPRSYSIDETVSDNLRVTEPFMRPKSPMPHKSDSTSSSPKRLGSDCEDRKLRISLSSPIRGNSPQSPLKTTMEKSESFEADMVFSKHFTQVFDEAEFESNENKSEGKSYGDPALTPESIGDSVSDSLETSTGQEYVVEAGQGKGIAAAKHFDPDDLLVGSPPMVSRPLGVKYWPPVDNLDQDLDAFGPVDKQSITRSESDDNSESRLDLDSEILEKEVEDGKKWLENQFEGAQQQQEDYSQFAYGQPLDQILEEEEDRYSHSSEDIKELQRFKESLSSTPDFDVIINKRHQINRSSEADDISMGSLTEFERLEREVGMGSGSNSRGSLGSNDSLEASNGNGSEKAEKPKPSTLASKLATKQVQDDTMSVSSLTSFELMEKACTEAAQIEAKAKLQEEVLSEIEEGHESQDSESAETISECDDQRSEKDYEDRLFEIDSIIKQAEANVEKFNIKMPMTEELSLHEIMGVRPESRTESVGSNDSLDCSNLPELPKEDAIVKPRHSGIPTRVRSATTSRTNSLQSMASVTSFASASTFTQFDPDSIKDRDEDLEQMEAEQDLMAASLDSLEGKTNTMVTSTDSLEGSQNKQDKMTISVDSIDNGSNMMTASMDSLDGAGCLESGSGRERVGFQGASALLTSTDSLESTSTNTRATASMLSSITSQGSETLVADDEFEHDDNSDSRSVRRMLMEQGNLPLEDSDDSLTYSYSSPQAQRTVTKFQRDSLCGSLENFDSSEEILETEEIDDKGNIIVKKVIQKRISEHKKVRLTDRKQEGYVSGDLSEKRDDSCEETIEEIDEFGNRRKYVVKRSIEPVKQATHDIVQARRQQQGLSPIGEVFKGVPEGSLLAEKRQAVHHTEQMTKVFDAPPSTPSPPHTPQPKVRPSQIPLRKH